MSNPLLIGQAPGPQTNPDMPLYPIPPTCTGGRLQKMMGLSRKDYLHFFDRTNLLHEFPGQCKRDDKFPTRDARIAARAMVPLLGGRLVIFIGRNVSTAFGYPCEVLPFFKWDYCPRWEFSFVAVPHPSGRNHWYNKVGHLNQALDFWVEFMRKQAVISNSDNVVAFSRSGD